MYPQLVAATLLVRVIAAAGRSRRAEAPVWREDIELTVLFRQGTHCRPEMSKNCAVVVDGHAFPARVLNHCPGTCVFRRGSVRQISYKEWRELSTGQGQLQRTPRQAAHTHRDDRPGCQPRDERAHEREKRELSPPGDSPRHLGCTHPPLSSLKRRFVTQPRAARLPARKAGSEL